MIMRTLQLTKSRSRNGGRRSSFAVSSVKSLARRFRRSKTSKWKLPRATWIEARGIRRWILRRLGLVGIVNPLTKSIWVMPGWVNNRDFYVHEMVHIEQIERDGRIWFTIKYLYWLVRYGYRGNPYEQEAYGREVGTFPRSQGDI